MKALYALYADPEAAQRAIDSLRAASRELKFDPRRIVIVSGEPYEGYAFADEPATRLPYLWAALGGAAGGILGYLLTMLARASYPIHTGMFRPPVWDNGLIVYQSAMLGVILATLVSLLIGARLPNFRGKIKDPETGAGKILVGLANPPENSQLELERRLRQAGASQVKHCSWL